MTGRLYYDGRFVKWQKAEGEQGADPWRTLATAFSVQPNTLARVQEGDAHSEAVRVVAVAIVCDGIWGVEPKKRIRSSQPRWIDPMVQSRVGLGRVIVSADLEMDRPWIWGWAAMSVSCPWPDGACYRIAGAL